MSVPRNADKGQFSHFNADRVEKGGARSTRYRLPGSFSWPDSAFHLQRCLLLSRFPREHGHEWVVMNVHLEAWDNGGIRKQELAFLRDLAINEYRQGNYVIVGGDWNSLLPGVRIDQFSSKEGPGPSVRALPDDLFPADWTWGIDRSRPSNRRTNAPYRPGMSYVTVIDGFVVSPNVHIESTETAPLDFSDTDHEPVFIRAASREVTPTILGDGKFKQYVGAYRRH